MRSGRPRRRPGADRAPARRRPSRTPAPTPTAGAVERAPWPRKGCVPAAGGGTPSTRRPARLPTVVGAGRDDDGTIERRPRRGRRPPTDTASAIDRDFHESAIATSVPRVIEYVRAITPTAAAIAPGAIADHSKRRVHQPQRLCMSGNGVPEPRAPTAVESVLRHRQRAGRAHVVERPRHEVAEHLLLVRAGASRRPRPDHA